MNHKKSLGKAYKISILLLREIQNKKFAIGFEKKLKKDEENKMRQKIQEKIERKKVERKKLEILKKEDERRKIYEKYLLPFQGGSNILKDFITNRF